MNRGLSAGPARRPPRRACASRPSPRSGWTAASCSRRSGTSGRTTASRSAIAAGDGKLKHIGPRAAGHDRRRRGRPAVPGLRDAGRRAADRHPVRAGDAADRAAVRRPEGRGVLRGRARPASSSASSPVTRRGWDFRDDLAAMGVWKRDHVRRCPPAVPRRPVPALPGDGDGDRRPRLRRPVARRDRAGRAERLAAMDRWQAAFEAPDRPRPATRRSTATCSSASSRPSRFAEAELREDAWNPLEWIYLLGGGLFDAARPRVRAARRPARVGGRPARSACPTSSTAARATLVGVDGRPVGRFQTETALKQLPGIGELIDDALARGRDRTRTIRPWRRSRRASQAAAATARAAIAGFETHLRDVVLPASEGEGRLGPRALRRRSCATRCGRTT